MTADDLTPEPDGSDADSFYRRYLVTCQRLGVEPVSPERASALVESWDAMFASAAATKQ